MRINLSPAAKKQFVIDSKAAAARGQSLGVTDPIEILPGAFGSHARDGRHEGA